MIKEGFAQRRKDAKMNSSFSLRLCAFAPLRLCARKAIARGRAARVAEVWCLQKTNSRRRGVDDARWVVELCTKQIAPGAPALHQTPFRRSAPRLVPCRG